MSDGVSRVSLEIGGTEIAFETGRLARQASGSVVVTAGDTMVLSTATAGNERDVDFLPLTVDVEERMYAVGKIPGSFFKREGRAGEKATLTARMIDRPLRPLFPKGWRRDTQLVSIPMSVDHDHPYDILAMNGASAALMVSDIPFPEPVGAVRIGQDLEGNFVVNPDEEWLLESPLDLIVAGTESAILMVEAGASEITEAEILDALDIAHGEIKRLCQAQHDLRKEAGKDKMDITPPQVDESILSDAEEPLRRRARRRHPGGGQARPPGRHQEGGGRGARDASVETPRPSPTSVPPSSSRSTSSRRRSSGAASPWTRSVPTAVAPTRSGTSGSRWEWRRARTAPRSSPAARPRPSPWPPSAPRVTRCVWTPSGSRPRSTTSTTTTSRRSRWERPGSCVDPSAATSVTARSPSVPSWPWSPRWRTSRTRSAWSRTSSSPTARRRWPPFVDPRWP